MRTRVYCICNRARRAAALGASVYAHEETSAVKWPRKAEEATGEVGAAEGKPNLRFRLAVAVGEDQRGSHTLLIRDASRREKLRETWDDEDWVG